MKFTNLRILTISLLLLLTHTAFTQPTNTHEISISKVLTVNFPDSVEENKSGSLHSYLGYGDSGLYEADYFDTIVVRLENYDDFNICLKSFVAGKFANPVYKMYDLTIRDTSIGNTKGFFLTGNTSDTLPEFQQFYCYITVANNKSYWFFAYQHLLNKMTQETKNFFKQIQFAKAKIREANYKMYPFRKHKKAGQMWYMSPELDYPYQPMSKSKKRPVNEDPTLPRKPPPPPKP